MLEHKLRRVLGAVLPVAKLPGASGVITANVRERGQGMGRGAGQVGGGALFGGALILALSAAGASAEGQWIELAEISASTTSSAAKVFIDLGSVRRRGRHFEVWELTRYQPITRDTRLGTMVRTLPETRTLWAIRCPWRSIGLVTVSSDGVFHPREERVKYQVPAPGSPASLIVEKLCDEMKLKVPEEPVPERTMRASNTGRKLLPLELPPTIAEADDD